MQALNTGSLAWAAANCLAYYYMVRPLASLAQLTGRLGSEEAAKRLARLQLPSCEPPELVSQAAEAPISPHLLQLCACYYCPW